MKRTTGAYIAFSELFDRKPTKDELLASFRHIPLERALILLVRVNLALRFAQEEPGKPNFGKLQSLLASQFLDKNTFGRLIERYGLTKTDERPIFISIHCLNMLRLVILESDSEKLQPMDNDQLRWDIGTGLLMMSDLLLTHEELRAITIGSPDDRRLSLMTQFLAQFELLNPPRIDRLAIRYQLMHRTVIRMGGVKRRISKECRSFDIEDTFRKITGLSLDRWLHSVFAINFYYQLSANPWESHEQYFTIDKDNFVGTSDISKAELDSIIATISSTLEDLAEALKEERWTDPRFNFVPFRKRPLVKLANGRLLCLDSTFLLEQVHVGVHWVMHDRLSKDRRDDLFKAWGILFEEYVNYLFDGMHTALPIKYYRTPK